LSLAARLWRSGAVILVGTRYQPRRKVPEGGEILGRQAMPRPSGAMPGHGRRVGQGDQDLQARLSCPAV